MAELVTNATNNSSSEASGGLETGAAKRGRGRPTYSEIRNNIVELLFFFKSCHGYEVYKHYCNIFPDVTMRSIYYHLRKGADLNEFVVQKVVKEKGDFSWGAEAEKIYYSNGPNAKPKGDVRVKEYFAKRSAAADNKLAPAPDTAIDNSNLKIE